MKNFYTKNNKEFDNTFLSEEDVGLEVELKGWVNSRRDHGGIIFIDLRDRSGIIQLVSDPEQNEQLHKTAEKLRDEFVLSCKGVIRLRGEGLENDKLKTGKIEVLLQDLKIQNESLAMPFTLGDKSVNEEIKLKYRYLDLRSNIETFQLRSKVFMAIRKILDSKNFIEVETPVLTKTTPEGARDYLLPSRVSEGDFFALPQSPQIFKQLLMVSGFEKYYQIVKCFRDEDLRADRQPEFTQLDLEMSFTSQEEVIELSEEIIEEMFKVKGVKIQRPFPKISYEKAMNSYGSDKPDTRFAMTFYDVKELFKDSTNEIFKEIANANEKQVIKAINAKNADKIFSKRQIKGFEEFVRKFGASGLGYFQMKEDGLKGPLLKFMSEESIKKLIELCNIEVGDVVFFGAGISKTVLDYMGRLRLELAKHLNLIKDDVFSFTWVLDFPMFEKNDDGSFTSSHHPFTRPLNMQEDLEKVSSISYDLALNGMEICGGSMRIHEEDLQKQVFKALNIGQEEAKEKFGFLLDALKYGAPEHGGIAFGLDRILMILANKQSIRDVIAFPKTQKAQCLLSQAPSSVNDKQLKELHIKLRK